MKITTNRLLTLTAGTLIATTGLCSAETTTPSDQENTSEPTKEQADTESTAAKNKKAKAEKKTAASPKKKSPKQSAKAKSANSRMEAAQKKLALENALTAEKIKKEQAKLRAQVARLKLEKELISETLAVAELKMKQELAKEEQKFKRETAQLTREARVAKLQAEMNTSTLKTKQAEYSLALADLENEVKSFEAHKRKENYAKNEPVYLADPLLENGNLVISDRRIDLNGSIYADTAQHISRRINYFNNKNNEHPIFIVIDDSPGGSVMAGMSILESMHGSDAPVYVVVKTFAASMAAAITTLAERSFAFPNAIILHHQVMSGTFGNLTETREHTKQLEEWWRRLAEPVAKKMGISRQEFIQKMYEETVSGDWSEFADKAKELKWVDHVVTNIKETSLLKNPDARSASSSTKAESTTEAPSNIIPRLNPLDMLYMHNPDGYYKFQK